MRRQKPTATDKLKGLPYFLLNSLSQFLLHFIKFLSKTRGVVAAIGLILFGAYTVRPVLDSFFAEVCK